MASAVRTAAARAAAARAAAARRSAGTRRRRGPALRLALAAGVLTVLAGGCATMPMTGIPQQVTPVQGGAGQGQEFTQLIPVPPGKGWSPSEIVSGFLAASATFTDNHAIARKYLAPPLNKSWTPDWSATVVGRLDVGRATAHAPKMLLPAEPPPRVVHIQFSGQILATLARTGQYVAASGVNHGSFQLVHTSGQWRISVLPKKSPLILTEPDFVRDYRPRNLYFLGTSGLVPDPVFVPQQVTDTATGLVKSLILGPTNGWQSGATNTGFPAGTNLIGHRVQVDGTQAIVNLGGAAATATATQVDQMAAQIVLTLTNSSYAQSAAIQSVQLEINGKVQNSGQRELPQSYAHYLPARTAERFYYIGGTGMGALSTTGQPAVQAMPEGLGQLSLNAIAVSPLGSEIAGILPVSDGCIVYSGALRHDARLIHRQVSGGTCRSLTFDGAGEIWVAAGTHVWMLPPSGQPAVPVTTPATLSSDMITDLRVAPDDTRVAMITRTSTGSARVWLGAISGSSTGKDRQLFIGGSLGEMQAVGPKVRDPGALSWYDNDDVLVLSRAGGGSQLYEIPLDGGAQVTPITTPPGTISITTAGSGGPLVISTAAGKIMKSTSQTGQSALPNFQDLTWQTVADGKAPAYPG